MTTISWDRVGDRQYETGLDHGVLYPPSGDPVPWNGLISVNTSAAGAGTSETFWDGVKIDDNFQPGNLSATITAMTYPDEFLECEGIWEDTRGAFLNHQPGKLFGLSYRTSVGNDTDEQSGYKIHLMYNLAVVPSDVAYQTISANVAPISFSWAVTGIPEMFYGYRPTAYLTFDTKRMYPPVLGQLEDILYGTETTIPRMPTPKEILEFISLTVTDNGDGTWTADGPSTMVMTKNVSTTILDDVTIMYMSKDTYTISSQ